MSVELHYETAGPVSASSLLMAGSLGTTLAMWDPQMPVLPVGVRVVRLDNRGHGRSPVPPGPYEIGEMAGDVLALLDRLALSRVSFCGLSIGGMIGIWVAAHAPERIDRLVLICTSAVMPAEAGYGERAARVRSAGTVEPIADAVVERWFTPDFARSNADLVTRFRAMLVSTPAEGYAGCCEAINGLDLRSDLGRIEAPTLVISGARDLATPPDRGRAIADTIRGARFEVVDAAHLASVQQADAVTDLIRDHLRRP